MGEPKYTVFVRVPIPRGDFVDPPPVHWDSNKDDKLWKILSGAAHTEIDWNQVAQAFDVPVDFLLQQVAYLTERHASQVRAQVRKATAAAKGSSAPSTVAGSEPGVAIHTRATSAMSGRRRSPMSRNDGSGVGTPVNTSIRPVVSRNTSANTTVLAGGSSPRPAKAALARPTDQNSRKRLSSVPIDSPATKSSEPQFNPSPDRAASPGPAESSSTSSDDESSPAQSRIIRRPPRFQQQEATPAFEDDDDEESEPAFQQYKAHSKPSSQLPSQDLASTLRGDKPAISGRSHHKAKNRIHHSQTSDDSAGSAAMVQRPKKSRDAKVAGPLSPHRAPESTGRSPNSKGKGNSQEGSDGTPSMGSSFSDLDDASVTQSALEEVLASHMNHGAGSRFSISQAFRSRYTPNSNQ